MQDVGYGSEGEGREGGKAGMGSFVEEGGVATEEAEDGDGQIEGFLERLEMARGEEGGRRAEDGVFDENAGFD